MSSILKVDEIQNTDGKTGLVITPDGSIDGVKFPEEVNPSGRVITSTTMSSYEEGTWVPTILQGSATTFDNPSVIYTKIGQVVTVALTVQIQGASSDLEISLPFQPKGHGVYTNQGYFLSGIGNTACYIDDQSQLRFRSLDGSAITVPWGGGVRATFTYLTDE
jgi:hypothetical protein